jgi:hypothetical protein
MRKVLTLLGDVVGGFGAGFLVYLVLGGGLGLMLATTNLNERRPCWPARTFTFTSVECESAEAQALWWGVVGAPGAGLTSWAHALRLAFDPIEPEENLLGGVVRGTTPVRIDSQVVFYVDTIALYASPVLVLLLSFVGFLAWHTRSALVAWALAFALVVEVLIVTVGA